MPESLSFCLDTGRLAARLPQVECTLVDSTGSTNADLLARARSQLPLRPQVLVAREQTAGRGRQGRSWLAKPGAALTFSVLVPWPVPVTSSAAVTLSCGLSLCQVLRQHGINAQVKWPNDLYLGNAKLGGLLTELADNGSGGRALVVGLGINVFLDHEQRKQIGQAAACLADVISPKTLSTDAEAWLSLLIQALLHALHRYVIQGFAEDRAAFMACCAWMGEEVSILNPTGITCSGVLMGVDESGQLLLRLPDDTQVAIHAGDLHLRRHADTPLLEGDPTMDQVPA